MGFFQTFIKMRIFLAFLALVSGDNDKTVDPNEVLTPFQNQLRAIYPPFPLMDIYQRQLRKIYGDHEAGKVYKKLVAEKKVMQPNQIKFDLNMDWLYDLMRNQTRRNYLQKLSEPSNVVLMSVSRFPMVDTHLGCWILVNFDSYDANQATADLVQMLSRHFYEKCSIGLVDITYPANWELLSPIVSMNTPSILLKRSDTKMVRFEFKPKDWSAMVMPLSTFGQEVGPTQISQLGEGLPGLIEKLIYEPLSDDGKIEAIYSPMQAMSNEKKQLMRFLIEQYRISQNKRVHGKLQADLDSKLYTEGSDDMMATWAVYIEEEMADGGLRKHLESALDDYWTNVPLERVDGDAYTTRLGPETSL